MIRIRGEFQVQAPARLRSEFQTIEGLSTGHRVVLVENAPDSIEQMRAILGSFGTHTSCVPMVRTALGAIDINPSDVLLSTIWST